jgi:hypothetical protein
VVETTIFCVGVSKNATTITKLVHSILKLDLTGIEAENQITMADQLLLSIIFM